MGKKLNKKGLSAVIASLLLIALTVVLVGIMWTIINNMIKKSTEGSEACFDIFEKVTLNPEYTCYTDNEFRFSIDIGDIDVDEVLVGISSGGSSSTFRISKTPSEIDYLVTYPGGSSNISLPSKNAGLSYVFNMAGAGYSGTPDSISIAPVIKGAQCDISDSMENMGRCTS